MHHPDQRELLGGPLLPYVAGRQEALPQCVRQNAGGVRGAPAWADRADEGGDQGHQRERESGCHPGRDQREEESHRRLYAGASGGQQQERHR